MVRISKLIILLFVSYTAFSQTPTFPRFRLIQLQQSQEEGQIITADSARNAIWSSDLRVQDSIFYIFGNPYTVDSTRLDNDTLKYYQNGNLIGFDIIATIIDSTRLYDDTLKYFQNGVEIGYDLIVTIIDSTRLNPTKDTLFYYQNGSTVGFDLIDGDATNELQEITEFVINNDSLFITLSDDVQKAVNLIPYINTDTSGFNRDFYILNDTLYIDDDNGTLYVDLLPYLDNTDEQTLSLVGNTLSISNGNNVDLSAYLDNTDTSGFNRSFILLNDTLFITDDNSTLSVILEEYTNTDTSGYNSNFYIVNDSLFISDGNNTFGVDLSYYTTDTSGYNFAFEIINDTLYIEDGNSRNFVSLIGYLDNTDTSGYNIDFSYINDTLYLTDGLSTQKVFIGGVNTDTSGYNFSFILQDSTLLLQDGNSPLQVDISAAFDNTDTSGYNSQLTLVDSILYITDGQSTLDIDLKALYDNIDTSGINRSFYISNDSLYIKDDESVFSVLLTSYLNTDTSGINREFYILNDTLYIIDDESSYFVDLTSYIDNTDNQQLTKSTDTIYLENGGFVTLLDDDPANELQTLTVVNDTLFLSNSNGIIFPVSDIDSTRLNQIGDTLIYYYNDSIVRKDPINTIIDVVSGCVGGLTESTDVYALFDMSGSVVTSNVVDIITVLSNWHSQYKLDNPSYTGSLYTIPILGLDDSERWLDHLYKIRNNLINVRTGFVDIDTIVMLPPWLDGSGGTFEAPNEMLLLGFVNESAYAYHDLTPDSFYLEPTSTFNSDLNRFIDEYGQMSYFKGILYPIYQTVSDDAFLLHAIAALEATTLTDQQLQDAFGGLYREGVFDIINTVNNYSVPLKDYGWYSILDKTSPASASFTDSAFNAEINQILSENNINFVPVLEDYSNNIITLRSIGSKTLDVTVDSSGCIRIEGASFIDTVLVDTTLLSGDGQVDPISLNYEKLQDTLSSFIEPGLGIDISYNDEDNSLLIQSLNFEEVGKNLTQDTLYKGYPVYQVDSTLNGNLVGIAYADAADPSKMPAVGVLEETLAPGEEGKVLFSGYIGGVNTSLFNTGDIVYVAAGGGYTNIRPYGEGKLVQNLGRVLKVHPKNGSGIIMGAGRSNDVPNLNPGNIFYGSVDSVAISVPLDSFVQANNYWTKIGTFLRYNEGNVGVGIDNLTIPFYNLTVQTDSFISSIITTEGIGINTVTSEASSFTAIGNLNDTTGVIQSYKSTGTPPIPSANDLALNPYGGNVGIRTSLSDPKTPIDSTLTVFGGIRGTRGFKVGNYDFRTLQDTTDKGGQVLTFNSIDGVIELNTISLDILDNQEFVLTTSYEIDGTLQSGSVVSYLLVPKYLQGCRAISAEFYTNPQLTATTPDTFTVRLGEINLASTDQLEFLQLGTLDGTPYGVDGATTGSRYEITDTVYFAPFNDIITTDSTIYAVRVTDYVPSTSVLARSLTNTTFTTTYHFSCETTPGGVFGDENDAAVLDTIFIDISGKSYIDTIIVDETLIYNEITTDTVELRVDTTIITTTKALNDSLFNQIDITRLSGDSLLYYRGGVLIGYDTLYTGDGVVQEKFIGNGVSDSLLITPYNGYLPTDKNDVLVYRNGLFIDQEYISELNSAAGLVVLSFVPDAGDRMMLVWYTGRIITQGSSGLDTVATDMTLLGNGLVTDRLRVNPNYVASIAYVDSAVAQAGGGDITSVNINTDSTYGIIGGAETGGVNLRVDTSIIGTKDWVNAQGFNNFATESQTLQTPRNIGLTGNAVQSSTAASFDGSADVNITLNEINATYLTTGTVPNARLSGSYGINVTGSAGSVDWNNVQNIPPTFPPSGHGHDWSAITSTPTTLEGYGIADAVTVNTNQTITGAKTFSNVLTVNNIISTERYSSNVVVGKDAGTDLLVSSAVGNTAVGKEAMANNVQGDYGVYLGYQAGGDLWYGDHNVYVGYNTHGNIVVTADADRDVSNFMTIVGSNAEGIGDMHEIVIGAFVDGIGDSTITIGRDLHKKFKTNRYIFNIDQNITNMDGYVLTYNENNNEIELQASSGGGGIAQDLTFNNSGSGDASGTVYDGTTARTISYNTVGAPATDGTNATGSWNINSATATRLATARTIQVTGSAISASNASSFDGSANINLNVTGLDAGFLTEGTVPTARLSGTYNINISGTADKVNVYNGTGELKIALVGSTGSQNVYRYNEFTYGDNTLTSPSYVATDDYRLDTDNGFSLIQNNYSSFVSLWYNLPMFSSNNYDEADFVVTEGNQTINGTKTFTSDIYGNITGNAATATSATNANYASVAGAVNYVSVSNTNSRIKIGYLAGSEINGNYNTIVGYNTYTRGNSFPNNYGHTVIGANSLKDNLGSANTIVGANTTSAVSGFFSYHTKGVFIGGDITLPNTNSTNQIVIGNEAQGRGSNKITLGNSNSQDLKVNNYVFNVDQDVTGKDGYVLTYNSGEIQLEAISASGDITGVTAGNGLTGGGSSGDVTLNVGAGTGIDVAADQISVDVSDFMTNGADNRIVTATGTDAMNAESGLTWDGDSLQLNGDMRVNNEATFTLYNTYFTSGLAGQIELENENGKVYLDYNGNLVFTGDLYKGTQQVDLFPPDTILVNVSLNKMSAGEMSVYALPASYVGCEIDNLYYSFLLDNFNGNIDSHLIVASTDVEYSITSKSLTGGSNDYVYDSDNVNRTINSNQLILGVDYSATAGSIKSGSVTFEIICN